MTLPRRLLLRQGDPGTEISNIRRGRIVFKGGAVFDSSKLYQARNLPIEMRTPNKNVQIRNCPAALESRSDSIEPAAIAVSRNTAQPGYENR